MVVEIRTSQDLLDLLDNNEEFRRAARRALLTDELLELPDIVREMQQTQLLMIQRMDKMDARMDRMDAQIQEMRQTQLLMIQRMDKMDARFEQVDARFEQVIAEMASMNKRIGNLEGRVDNIDKRVVDIDGRLRGWELERESIRKLLPRLAREYEVIRIRAVSADASRSAVNVNYVWAARFDEALDAARLARRITIDEEDILGRTDIVAWGRRRVDEARLWFAVQAAATIGNDDVERAAAGAVALRKVTGEDAAAVVYGRRIADQQWDRAGELGVRVMLDEDGGRG